MTLRGMEIYQHPHGDFLNKSQRSELRAQISSQQKLNNIIHSFGLQLKEHNTNINLSWV